MRERSTASALAHATTGGTAGAVERRRPLRWLVAAGFLARGITYGIIGSVALAIAAGAGTAGTRPDQQGALALIVRAPLGSVALGVIAAGLLAYALWKLHQGLRSPTGETPGLVERVSGVAGGISYLLFFALAVRVLTGSASGSSGSPRGTAAGVLGWPGGPEFVAAGGAALILASLWQAWDAVRDRFAGDSRTERMGPDERRLFLWLGRVGITARALVFVLVGYFLIRTALSFDPRQAVGVDGALARLHHQAYGPWLLGLVALGLLTFSAFSLLEARYRRL